MNAVVTWKKGMAFEAQLRTHRIALDAKAEAGGQNSGPTPKELVLAGVCGCTGMDVASILKTMHQDLEDLRIVAEAKTREEYPQVFTAVHLTYEIQGKTLNPNNVKRAVELSQTKYCGVSAMVAESAEITYSIILNGMEISRDKADFSKNLA